MHKDLDGIGRLGSVPLVILFSSISMPDLMPGIIGALRIVVFPELILAAFGIDHLEAIESCLRLVPGRLLGEAEDHTKGVIR